MRITSKIMINNAKYWLSKQAERLNNAETVSASGKKVNSPSDDPRAAGIILEYRSDISRYEQYEKNLIQASTLIETGEEILDSVDSFLDQAIDITAELATGKSDYTETLLTSLESIYDSIMDIANTTCCGDYLYGGNLTNSVPFSDKILLSAGESVDLGYYLTSDASDITITIYDSNKQAVRTITTSGTTGSNTVTWDGLDNSGSALESGTYTFSVNASDTSGATVAASCYQGDTGKRKIVISDNATATINSNGGAIFTEALSALSRLIGSFETGSTQEAADEVVTSLNNANDIISSERVALSNIYSQINTSFDRVDALSIILNERLIEIENGNTAENAVNLTAQETAYKITTEAVARILNLPKLSDYV